MHSTSLKSFWLFQKHRNQRAPLDNWKRCCTTGMRTSLEPVASFSTSPLDFGRSIVFLYIFLVSQITWGSSHLWLKYTFSLFACKNKSPCFNQVCITNNFVFNTACYSSIILTVCSLFLCKPFWDSAGSINIWNSVLNISALLLCKRATNIAN